MPVWRIFYGDGSVYSSEDGRPENAPGRNVQAIVQPDPDVGRHVLSGFDYYWHDANEWWGGEIFGLWDYLERPGPKVVKFARTIGNQEFRAIRARAIEDPDFPRKSGWRAGERR